MVETTSLENWYTRKGIEGSNPSLSAMFTVYVLWSDRLQKRYIGSTKNIDKRLMEHNSGKNRFTKGGVPWKVVYIESFQSNSEGRKREVFLKSGVGRRFLDDILKGSAP